MTDLKPDRSIDMSDDPTKARLTTKRLLLAPVTPEDHDDFHRIISSSGVHEGTLTFPRHPDESWSRERFERVLERSDDSECYFIHAHLLESPGIGAVANLSVDLDERHSRGHLGYMVDEHHRGRGYATEMLMAVVEHAFEGLKINKVCASTWTWNEPSSNLLARTGFTREGHARQHYCKDGEYIDAYEWGMLASDPRPWKD